VAHPASYPMGTKGTFLGGKAAGGETDHSPPSCVDLHLHSPNMNSWRGAKLKLHTYILLRALFLNIVKTCSSLSVRDEFSRPYKTTGKIMVLYILVSRLFDRWQEDERFWTERYQSFLESNVFLIFFVNVNLIC
jgi:hypothetical protein